MSFRARLVYMLAFPALLLLCCAVSQLIAQGGGVKGGGAKGKAPVYDYSKWNGIWLLKCDYEPNNLGVLVAVARPRSSSPHIVAQFPEGEGDCTIGTGDKWRIPFLRADVTGLHLKGTIYFCTTDKALADANNLTAVFERDFEGDFDPNNDTISGGAKSEMYISPASNSSVSSTQYTRDAPKDHVVKVTLTLKDGKGVDKHPKLPDNRIPTPTPSFGAHLNDTLIGGMNRTVDGERAKNRNTHPQTPPETNPTPSPDTNPLLGINDTVDNVMKDLNGLINGEPKSPSATPTQQHK